MTTLHETAAVAVAIQKVCALLAKEGIAKDRKNQAQGYAFRGIDDVYNALAPALVEAGLCIIPRLRERIVTERKSNNGGTLFCVTVVVDYTIMSASGAAISATSCGEAMDSGDKATNKAMSAAYKYLAMQLFCIPTEGDNDADASSPQVSSDENPLEVVAGLRASKTMPELEAWAKRAKALSGKDRDAAAAAYKERKALLSEPKEPQR